MFVYVAVLSHKQRKTMLADAFAAAKKNAAELAEAAGMKLGALVTLQGNFSNSRLPDTWMRSTQKPFSGLWKVTRSTVPERCSNGPLVWIGAGMGAV